MSLLDTDLYKLTMQNCILSSPYATAQATYAFTNRGTHQFTRKSVIEIQNRINALGTIRLQPEERDFLELKCTYFSQSYLDFLSEYRFDPSQVTITFVPETNDGEYGNISILVAGLWVESILWEVPLMAIISEVYFTTVDKEWDYVGQKELAKEKGEKLFKNGIMLAEFGTRRRRSYEAQRIVIEGLLEANGKEGKGKGALSGSSNVHFCHKYGLSPIGTIAHEFIMAIAALEGYEDANGKALDMWDQCYPSGALSIALTDTFTTEAFFETFIAKPIRARAWRGLRQDSGDANMFILAAKAAYETVGADPSEKILVFSDGLDVNRCLELSKATLAAGMMPSFGVGTFLTNDFKRVSSPVVQADESIGSGIIGVGEEQSTALNMVIKLRTINGRECVKLSDDLGKTTGNELEVAKCKAFFGLD